MAAALTAVDSPELHAKDTEAAGAGLVEPTATRALTDAGRETVEWLAALGAPFDRDADGGFVVTSGVFTDEALAFAKGKNIELMDGKALHALISGVTAPPRFFRDPLSITTNGAPFCPECQSRMVKRKAKRGSRAGQAFWGCIRYPDCRGSRPI